MPRVGPQGLPGPRGPQGPVGPAGGTLSTEEMEEFMRSMITGNYLIFTLSFNWKFYKIEQLFNLS